MKYPYVAISPPDERGRFKKKPLVEIEIFGRHRTIKEFALVDSGADVSLCNIQIAHALAIDLAHAEPKGMIGITGRAETRATDIEIRVRHLDQRITIPVRFIDSPYVGVLLGQERFFDLHKIKFEKDHDMFEITPAKKR
jgi:hypothetical protein